MGQPQHGYTTRTARAEASPEDSGISSRQLQATRGCQVSRATRHEGTRDPDKQPHHHQKQRQSGGGGPPPTRGLAARSGGAPPHPHHHQKQRQSGGAAPEQKRCIAYGSGAAPQHTRTNAELANRATPPPQPARAQDARRTPGGRWAALLRPRPTRCPNTQRTPTSSHGDRGRGRGWLGRRARRSAYSLTPPAVRPETMYFCRYWNSRITGMAAMTEPAAKMLHGAVRSSEAHMYMPTARVN